MQVVVAEVGLNVYVVAQDLSIPQLLAHHIRDEIWVESCALDISGQFCWEYGVGHRSWAFVLDYSCVRSARRAESVRTAALAIYTSAFNTVMASGAASNGLNRSRAT